MNPFDFVNSINHTKKDLFQDPEVSETDYVSFVVNRSVSYFPETILLANDMNKAHIANKLQYHYLLNTVRPGKRYAKWVKREDDSDLQAVREFYGYSMEKALQAMRILTPQNIHYIKQKLQRGGSNDQIGNTSRGETKNR
jgi:hypothetical protein